MLNSAVCLNHMLNINQCVHTWTGVSQINRLCCGVASLTELVLALDRFGGEGRFALPHLVDGGDSELVA